MLDLQQVGQEPRQHIYTELLMWSRHGITKCWPTHLVAHDTCFRMPCTWDTRDAVGSRELILEIDGKSHPCIFLQPMTSAFHL